MRDTRTAYQLALAQAKSELRRARICLVHPRGPKLRQALEAMLTACWLMERQP